MRDAIVGNTFFDFRCDTPLIIIIAASQLPDSFSIRQKYLEAALREAILSIDSTALRAPAKLIDYSVDPTAEYPVTATIQEAEMTYQVRWLVHAECDSHFRNNNPSIANTW